MPKMLPVVLLFTSLLKAQDGCPKVLLDPYVPPASRKASKRPPTAGKALQAQVEQKLKAAFDAADATGQGSLSLEEAREANLGFVLQHFETMDTRKAGRVTFDDLKCYLRTRGARI
jgi:hypothetical protein